MSPLIIALIALGGLVVIFEVMRLVLPRISSTMTTTTLTGLVPGIYAYMQGLDLGALIGPENVSLALVIVALFMGYTRLRTKSELLR